MIYAFSYLNSFNFIFNFTYINHLSNNKSIIRCMPIVSGRTYPHLTYPKRQNVSEKVKCIRGECIRKGRTYPKRQNVSEKEKCVRKCSKWQLLLPYFRLFDASNLLHIYIQTYRLYIHLYSGYLRTNELINAERNYSRSMLSWMKVKKWSSWPQLNYVYVFIEVSLHH